MSRRKQARPKSCKLEGLTDKREEVSEELSARDLEATPSTSGGWSRDQMDTDPSETKTSEDGDSNSNNPKERCGSGDMAEANSSVFTCELCNAVFDSLDHFMEHKNYVCTVAALDPGIAWVVQEVKQEWSSSDSASGSPLPATSVLEDGVGTPLPMHLPEEQLPYAIGITESHPFGCQFCEKAFPKTAYLHVHERVHSDQLPFKCEHCQRLFRQRRNRDRHAKLHACDRRLKCAQCGATFAKREEHRAHLRTHENSKLYQCPVCQAGYASSPALAAHLDTHKQLLDGSASSSASDLSTCVQCGQSFETPQLLQEHMSIHTAAIKVKLEKLSCDICSQIFTCQAALDAHMEQAHYISGSSHHASAMDLDSSPLMLKCPMCPLSFGETLSLCQHLMSHTATAMTLTTDLDPMSLVRGAKDMLSPNKDSSRSHTPRRGELSPGGAGRPKTPQQQGALVCPYCLSDSFDTLEVLELHMQSVHSVKSSEIYTCNYCNAPYPNLYSLHDHMNVVHRNHPGIGIKYPCSLCNNQFPSIEALSKHKSLTHSYQEPNDSSRSSSGIDAAFCSHCSTTFPTAKQLEDHMVSKHGASISHKQSGKPRVRKAGSKGNKENKQGTKGKSGRQVSSAASAATSSTEPSSSTSATSPRLSAMHLPESITCDECNATFHELVNFQAHMKLHLDAALAKFTCKKCGQQLGSQEQLEAHLSLHYLCLATEYGCTSCMKLFSKPDELQKHLMDIHAHHLYRCALCKEIFDSKVNIQVHFAIKHSNECKLFKCTQCANIFRSEMEWQVHVRVNHLHLAKPYRCLFCAESFTSEMELQCHLTTHSKPFRCTMCEQAFHIEYLLDQHMQTEHADVDSKASIATVLLSSPVANSSSINSVSIKEEADSSTSILAGLIQSQSSRPPSQNSDMRKSVSPAIPQLSLSPLAVATPSAVWKNSEALHVCNICDSRFTQSSLLAIHKAQEHGLKVPGTGGSSSSLSPSSGKFQSTNVSPRNFLAPTPTVSLQSSREKFLQQNQTLVSVLTAETQSLGTTMACSLCSQTFRNPAECSKHMRIHANSTSLKCNICDEVFPSDSTLAEHKLQHCKIQQGNACFVCKLSLKTEEQFYSHAQEHGYQGTMLQCILCRQTLASVVELQMHGKHHYQARPSFYTCCVCWKTFDAKENLISKLNSTGRTYYVCKPCYHGESPLHTCDYCSEKFASKAQLDAHVASHNLSSAFSTKSASSTSLDSPQTFQCIKCQESFSTEYEIQVHVANHMMQEGTLHECKLCMSIFESPAKLQCHLIEHSYKTELEIQCPICAKVFGSAAEIQMHALEHGVQGRKHVCGECNQRFFFPSELDNHVQIYNHVPAAASRSAKSSAWYECQDCKKDFSSATALANHCKTHERRDVNLKCSLCAQTYSSVFLMQQHFLAAHMSGLDLSLGMRRETHSCALCKEQFATADGLQVHILSIHKSGSASVTEWVCPVCNKKFSQAKLLTGHLRSHSETNPKAFSCSICLKKFAREENLQGHMKTHTLVCPLCNKSFMKRAEISEHLKTHFAASKVKEELLSSPATDCDKAADVCESSGKVMVSGADCSPDHIAIDETDNNVNSSQPIDGPEKNQTLPDCLIAKPQCSSVHECEVSG